MPTNTTIQPALELAEKDQSKMLGVKFGSHIIQPGTYIGRADAQIAPDLSFDVPDPEATYIAIGLDLDAPHPSFSLMSPILHWVQPGLKADGTQLKATEPVIASYIAPGPPPGSPPHRYPIFLYKQPEGFDSKAHILTTIGNLSRIRYSLDDWVQKVNLGQVIAANYFTSN